MFSDDAPSEVKEELLNILSSDFHPNGFRAMAKSMAIDSQKLLPKIKVPTLLIWGESDKRSPLNVAEQFHNAIKGSELEIISHAGHVSNLENPEQFNKAVKDFCLAVSH
jgi:pimeloyl-ACP methyl ester carboxylesterase